MPTQQLTLVCPPADICLDNMHYSSIGEVAAFCRRCSESKVYSVICHAAEGKQQFNVFYLNSRRGRVVNAMPRPLYTRERDTIPILQEAGWAPGPVGVGAENLAPTRIRCPDRLASSESLQGLSYRGPHTYCTTYSNIYTF